MLATASRRNSFTCADGDDAVLELWNTIFTGATPVVFAIAAAAALVQLRHLHASYQITAASTLLQTYWSPQFQNWLHFVNVDLDERLADPAFRAELQRSPVDRNRHPEVYVCEYFGLIGSYMKHGLMPRQIYLEAGGRDAVDIWIRLWPVVELMRRGGTPTLFENFEYLAVVCQRWPTANADGNYPKQLPRYTPVPVKSPTS